MEIYFNFDIKNQSQSGEPIALRNSAG